VPYQAAITAIACRCLEIAIFQRWYKIRLDLYTVKQTQDDNLSIGGIGG
jgi:hypothetical protein